MRLQMSYDLDVAERASARQIRKEIRPLKDWREAFRSMTCERYAGTSMYDDELLGCGMARSTSSRVLPVAMQPGRSGE
jgi:hypothetical protein